MKELKNTVALMLSKDYEDRFKAEYYQLQKRYVELYKTIHASNKMEEYGIGKKISQKDYEIMNEQFRYMEGYLDCLKRRAIEENINVEGE